MSNIWIKLPKKRLGRPLPHSVTSELMADLGFADIDQIKKKTKKNKKTRVDKSSVGCAGRDAVSPEPYRGP